MLQKQSFYASYSIPVPCKLIFNIFFHFSCESYQNFLSFFQFGKSGNVEVECWKIFLFRINLHAESQKWNRIVKINSYFHFPNHNITVTLVILIPEYLMECPSSCYKNPEGNAARDENSELKSLPIRRGVSNWVESVYVVLLEAEAVVQSNDALKFTVEISSDVIQYIIELEIDHRKHSQSQRIKKANKFNLI